MDNPNYYAIIPANVRYDKRLSANAKLLYGEITALSNKNGVCFATNQYFANLYGLSSISISRLIKSLKDNGYINTQITYKDGTNEIDKRYIQICKEGINNFDNTPINKNDKENNTSSTNNTSINNTPYNPPKGENKKINEELFNKLWNEYPKKKSKGNVEKWFEKNKPSEDLINLMIDKLKILKTTEQWTKKNGQFIPYPTTWLNAKGWEDEVTTDSSIPEWFDKKIEEKNVSDLEEEEFLKKIKEARGE